MHKEVSPRPPSRNSHSCVGSDQKHGSVSQPSSDFRAWLWPRAVMVVLQKGCPPDPIPQNLRILPSCPCHVSGGLSSFVVTRSHDCSCARHGRKWNKRWSFPSPSPMLPVRVVPNLPAIDFLADRPPIEVRGSQRPTLVWVLLRAVLQLDLVIDLPERQAASD